MQLVESGSQPLGSISDSLSTRVVRSGLDQAIQEVGGVTVATPQLTQFGQCSQVGRVGGKAETNIEQPVEVARGAAPERDGEVVEHPLHDRAGRHRFEVDRIERSVGAVDCAKPGLARGRRDPCTLVVRVDESVAIVAFADKKVAGHPDADEVDAESASGFDEDDRQRDGHAHAPTDDLVQIGIARIVVVAAVACEPLAHEQVTDQAFDAGIRARGSDVVEGAEAARHIHFRVGPRRGQQQQCLVEWNLARARQDVGEAIRRSHTATVANYGDRVPSIHPYLSVAPPIAFAHRGGASAHPENTERAFRHAVDLGYTHLETDVHVTRDGVAIAFHDDRLDRVTDAEGVIADLPWADVKRALVDGTEPIMRLAEVFEAFPESRLNLDPKHGAAVEPLAEAILAAGAVDRVMVGAFSDKRIAAVQRLVGENLAVSAGPKLTAKLVAESRGLPVKAPWVHAAQVPVKVKGVPMVTETFVEHLHSRDIQVHVWTVNEADEMRRLLDLGVDGIMTDQTELLKSVFMERDVWP